MDEESIEVRGETARQLKAIAKNRGLTLQELVTHILLDYLENCESEESETEEDIDEEEEED